MAKTKQEEVRRHLLAHGIRPSLQRMAVMDYLNTHHTHPTVEEIYLALHPSIPTLSKTTVYNTLRILVEHKAAQVLTIDDKEAHFDGVVEQHGHFFCRGCERIFDIPMNTELFNASIRLDDSFRLDNAELYLHGWCPECRRKKESTLN